MLKENIAKWYRKIPVIRELRKISDGLSQIHLTLSTVQAVRVLDFELPGHPRYGEPRRLLRYSHQVCSQNGEDGIIREIFRRVGITTQVFVEIGVGNGVENNTAFLLSQGWTGFWIDGDPAFLKSIEGKAQLGRKRLRSLASFVTRENANCLMTELEVPKEFDLLSIDIDQN